MRSGFDNKKGEVSEKHSLWYSLMLIINEMQAGSLPLNELVNASRKRCINDFRMFLQVLEVYGVGYLDDIDKVKYSNRSKITHE